jgi:hypothetical protein
MLAKKDDKDKLKAIGYLGGGRGPVNPDWTHFNGVAYNADLDQIVLSVHSFSEIWIIDHSTTTGEAAGHKGGRSGKGGDLLYRWGNPRVYRAGTVKDQKLFSQHNAHWIPKGYPGEGHLLVFNATAGPTARTRRWTRSLLRWTPMAATSASQGPPMVRTAPCGAMPPPRSPISSPCSSPARSGSPTAARSSARATTAPSSR